jgi:hypothetical protein
LPLAEKGRQLAKGEADPYGAPNELHALNGRWWEQAVAAIRTVGCG